MSSFVFHSSLLTAKGVDLVVHMVVLCVIHSGYFDYRGAFQKVLLELNIADNEVKWILHFSDIN